MTTVDLPYFDILLPHLDRGDHDLCTAFGRHVHWGYWDEDHRANGSLYSFAEAAERMCRRVCDAGRVADDQRILDVGCGVGGTLASLNERFEGLSLTGLNIDRRQLDYAEQHVTARDGSHIALVEGDACDMPFEDESFDVVLAVECAFHFSSRERFFSEAARVLRPGGKLALCDFMPINAALPFMFLQQLLFNGYVTRIVGPTNISCSRDRYVELAEAAGLDLVHEEDVTPNTLPTYAVLRRIARHVGVHALTAQFGTAGMELIGRLGLLRYLILTLEKPQRES